MARKRITSIINRRSKGMTTRSILGSGSGRIKRVLGQQNALGHSLLTRGLSSRQATVKPSDIPRYDYKVWIPPVITRGRVYSDAIGVSVWSEKTIDPVTGYALYSKYDEDTGETYGPKLYGREYDPAGTLHGEGSTIPTVTDTEVGSWLKANMHRKNIEHILHTGYKGGYGSVYSSMFQSISDRFTRSETGQLIHMIGSYELTPYYHSPLPASEISRLWRAELYRDTTLRIRTERGKNPWAPWGATKAIQLKIGRDIVKGWESSPGHVLSYQPEMRGDVYVSGEYEYGIFPESYATTAFHKKHSQRKFLEETVATAKLMIEFEDWIRDERPDLSKDYFENQLRAQQNRAWKNIYQGAKISEALRREWGDIWDHDINEHIQEFDKGEWDRILHSVGVAIEIQEEFLGQDYVDKFHGITSRKSVRGRPGRRFAPPKLEKILERQFGEGSAMDRKWQFQSNKKFGPTTRRGAKRNRKLAKIFGQEGLTPVSRPATRIQAHVGPTLDYQPVDSELSFHELQQANQVKEEFKEIMKNFRKVMYNAGIRTIEHYRNVIQRAYQRSQKYVPRKTGRLAASGGYIVNQVPYKPKGTNLNLVGMDAAIYYGLYGEPPYALIVHEDMDKKHEPPTSARYLARALEETATEIMGHPSLGIQRMDSDGSKLPHAPSSQGFIPSV